MTETLDSTLIRVSSPRPNRRANFLAQRAKNLNSDPDLTYRELERLENHGFRSKYKKAGVVFGAWALLAGVLIFYCETYHLGKWKLLSPQQVGSQKVQENVTHSTYSYNQADFNELLDTPAIWMQEQTFAMILDNKTDSKHPEQAAAPDPDADRPRKGDPLAICQELLDEYSTTLANFQRCLNSNSRPVGYCFHCVKYASLIEQSYGDIKEGRVILGGKSCYDFYANQDRVDVLTSTYEINIGRKSLWTKGACKACFDGPLSNPSPNSMAIEFLNRYKAAVACMQPYVKGGIYESAKVPGKNQSQACPVCKKDFDHVKDYYNANLRDDRGFWSFENVCIDLQDRMNNTFRLWDNEFKCLEDYYMPIDNYFTMALALVVYFIFIFNNPFSVYPKKQSNILDDFQTPPRQEEPTVNTAPVLL